MHQLLYASLQHDFEPCVVGGHGHGIADRNPRGGSGSGEKAAHVLTHLLFTEFMARGVREADWNDIDRQSCGRCECAATERANFVSDERRAFRKNDDSALAFEQLAHGLDGSGSTLFVATVHENRANTVRSGADDRGARHSMIRKEMSAKERKQCDDVEGGSMIGDNQSSTIPLEQGFTAHDIQIEAHEASCPSNPASLVACVEFIDIARPALVEVG